MKNKFSLILGTLILLIDVTLEQAANKYFCLTIKTDHGDIA